MKILINVSEKTEATSYPWWIVIDASKIIPCCPDEDDECAVPSVSWRSVANNVYGPFFSREEAERFIERNKHNLGKDTICYCMSAWDTGGEYVSAINKVYAESKND